MEIFNYSFFTNAFIAAVVLSIICGYIGSYIVVNRKVFIAGGISHASFSGLGIACYFGFDFILGAGISALIFGFLIEYYSSDKHVRTDSVIGIIWAFGMSLGILFVYLTPGYIPDLMTYLFGNILSVTVNDIYAMIFTMLVIAVFFYSKFMEILYVSFDDEYASLTGIKVNLIKYILICLVSLSIVVTIKMAGIILVISLLTIPQSAASVFSKTFKQLIFLSVIISVLSSMCGLIMSYYINIPSGASIVMIQSVIFFLCKIIKK